MNEGQVLFNKGKGTPFRRAENDDFRLLQILRIDGVHDSHGQGLLGHTFRAVQANHRMAQLLQPFGKGASHEAKADDGDGNLSKVTVHNGFLYMFYIRASRPGFIEHTFGVRVDGPPGRGLWPPVGGGLCPHRGNDSL